MATIYNFEFVKEKIANELEALTQSSDKKVRVIGKHVAEKLLQFAENPTFGLKIQESESTLTDCCKHVLKNVTNHISDIEVYKKAAKFYFPKSDVEFTMNIIVSEDQKKRKNQKISISLDDLW